LNDLKFKITALANVTKAFGAVKNELRGVRGALTSVTDQAKRAGRAMRNIGAGLSAGVTAPLVALGVASVRNFDTQVKAQAAVAAALKSTGNAAGFTQAQLEGMASKLQGLTTFGDEAILRDVTAPLLTFTKVAGETFDRAQAATLDYATLLGYDLKTAALTVGKALNDPVKGINALSRAGVQFSDSQKAMIKSLAETGDVAGAQAIILAELETQFKGQAEAAAATPLGQWDNLKNAIGDVSEELGKQIVPFLQPLAEMIRGAVKWFQALDESTKKNIVIFGGFAAAIGPVVAALGLITIAVGAILTPVGAVVAGLVGLAALGAVIYRYWEPIKGWFSGLWEGIKNAAVAGWGWIKSTIAAYAPQWLKDLWSGLAGWFAGEWEIIKLGVSIAWDLIKGLFTGKYSVDVLIKQAWAGLSSWFSGIWSSVKGEFENAWLNIKAEVSQWPERMMQIGRDMLAGLALGMKGGSPEVNEMLLEAGRNATEQFKAEYGIKSPSRVYMEIGKNLMQGLGLGIRNESTNVQAEMQKATTGLAVPLQNSPITDLIVGLINKTTTFKDYFINAMKQAGDSLLKFALNSAWGTLANKIGSLANAGGGGGGGLGGLFSGLITKLIGGLFGSANGNVFAAGAPVAFATGGVVNAPTLFPMPGRRTGLMGEAGPEAIMPLTRIGGSLGVRALLPRGGGTSIAISVDARGAQDPAAVEAATDRALARATPALLAASRKITIETVGDMKRRGRMS